ncbi:endothelin-converting protein [Cytophagales bacterium WSM2-2]|nr:endothelin-converting protein [Cytophagales bacterium WSM2-2]
MKDISLFSKKSLLGCAFLLSTFVAFSQQDPGKAKFLDPSNMNTLVKPGDNFVEYAGGIWLKKNQIPAKETRWGSFNILRDFNVKALRTILTEAAADTKAQPGSVKKRVGDFFSAAMDTITLEQLGAGPIQADLKRVNGLTDRPQVVKELIYQRSNGIGGPLFGFFVGQDRKHPDRMALQLSQGGLTLPDRDYYLKSDQRSKKIQIAYNTYITTLFKLSGSSEDQAKKNAESIFGLEQKLAKAQMSRTEMRDPQKTYNKFAIADFTKKTPSLDWQMMLADMNIKGQDSILVNVPKFFPVADSLVKNAPLEDLKVYLQWNMLRAASAYMSKAFTDADFAYQQVLTGQKVPTPRWQRASSLTDGSVGELLGQLYVEQHFKPEAKARMKEMITNLIKAYEIRIKQLDWMSDVTKERALAKLKAFTPKIAYPDQWRKYDGLEVNSKTLLQNVRNTNRWAFKEMVAQLGKPVDRTRWGMTPPTVNAYYNPVMNEIVFPAGILQYPFFHPEADDAFNYGAIGAVIGHEISHGFDDSGSQYDKDGSLRNWWTPEDRKRFDEKAKQLQLQFDAYTVLDTLHVNGKLTMGENIGDLGGLNAAYEAFKMTAQGKSDKKIDGFTPDQRFFLSWAQVWRSKTLPETSAQLILTDPHSPGEYRAIGAPTNMDAWYKAFNIQPGDKLYKKPEDRIKIW